MNSLHHTFDIDIAQRLGSIEAAIIVHHFQHWIRINKKKKKNLYDGSCWTYQTTRNIEDNFPYMTKEKIRNALDLLTLGKTRAMKEQLIDPILKKGNYNKSSYDRTIWYAFINEEMFIDKSQQIHLGDPTNGKVGSNTPIPDTITNTLSLKRKVAHHEDQNSTENHRTKAVQNSPPKNFPPQALQLSALLLELIKVRAPKTKANINNWAKELDLMHRVDALSWEEIERLIRFVHQEDDFWFEQILSTKKLRKHATALTVKMNKNKPLPSAQPKKQSSLLPYDNDPELRAEERRLWLEEQQRMQQQHKGKQDASRA